MMKNIKTYILPSLIIALLMICFTPVIYADTSSNTLTITETTQADENVVLPDLKFDFVLSNTPATTAGEYEGITGGLSVSSISRSGSSESAALVADASVFHTQAFIFIRFQKNRAAQQEFMKVSPIRMPPISSKYMWMMTAMADTKSPVS